MQTDPVRAGTFTTFIPSNNVLRKQNAEAASQKDILEDLDKDKKTDSNEPGCFAKITGFFCSTFSAIGGFFASIAYWFLENICCCICGQSTSRALAIVAPVVEARDNDLDNDDFKSFKAMVEQAYSKLFGTYKVALQDLYIKKLEKHSPVDEEAAAPVDEAKQRESADAAFRNVTEENVNMVGKALSAFARELVEGQAIVKESENKE